MPQPALTTTTPDGRDAVVFFGVGAKDAHRALRHISSPDDRVFYAWKSGSEWTAQVSHEGYASAVGRERYGCILGRNRVIEVARRFADDFDVRDLVEEWIEDGPRAKLAIVARIYKPTNQKREEQHDSHDH